MGERKKWNKDRVIKSRMAAEKSRPQKVKNKKKVRGNNYRKGARKLYGEGKGNKQHITITPVGGIGRGDWQLWKKSYILSMKYYKTTIKMSKQHLSVTTQMNK